MRWLIDQMTKARPGRHPSSTGAAATTPDERLVATIAEGDRQAFEVLFERYYRRLFGFCARWLSHPENIEEVVDDVLFIVWRDASNFKGHSRVSTWIFGIAYRQTQKALRHQIHRQTREHEALEEMAEPSFEDRAVKQFELRASLDQALQTLPPEQRAVLELTFFEGCSYQEIAAILDCPVNTVKTRMFHARRKLRAVLPSHGWPAPVTGEAQGGRHVG